MNPRVVGILAVLGPLAAAILVAALPSAASAQALGTSRQPLSVLTGALWRGPVPVCWENGTPPNTATERQWVRDAVAISWEKESAARFVGWDACRPDSVGVRVLDADQHPHVKDLGGHLNGVRDGMVLNFTFVTALTRCRDGGNLPGGFGQPGSMPAASEREYCIKLTAVHEFGHALGIAHEQNRPDAPDLCRQEAQGRDGDWHITPYDPVSVMNYCHPTWNGGGMLSQTDIDGVVQLYGRAHTSMADRGPRIAALSTVPGGTSLFTVGSDGSIWSLYFDPRSPAPAWTAPFRLSPPDLSASRDVTALSTVVGGTSLFTMGHDGSVWSSFFDPRSAAPAWVDWFSLGGSEVLGARATTQRVTALSTVPGGTSLYVIGHADTVWTKFYEPRGPNPYWSDWIPLGGQVRSGSRVTALSTVEGGTSLYVIGTDGAVYSQYFDPGNGRWSGWFSLGAVVKPGTEITALSTVPGGTTLFVVGLDSAVWSNYFDPRGGAWSGWFSLGGVVREGGGVTAVSSLPGGTQIFVPGLDDAVWSRFFDPRDANPHWVDWFSLGGAVRGGGLEVGTLSTVPGGTSIFVKREDGYIDANYFDPRDANPRWVGWFPLGK